MGGGGGGSGGARAMDRQAYSYRVTSPGEVCLLFAHKRTVRGVRVLEPETWDLAVAMPPLAACRRLRDAMPGECAPAGGCAMVGSHIVYNTVYSCVLLPPLLPRRPPPPLAVSPRCRFCV